jgi:hypothetical protein
MAGRVVLRGTSGERRPVMIPFDDYASRLAACTDSSLSGTTSKHQTRKAPQQVKKSRHSAILPRPAIGGQIPCSRWPYTVLRHTFAARMATLQLPGHGT